MDNLFRVEYLIILTCLPSVGPSLHIHLLSLYLKLVVHHAVVSCQLPLYSQKDQGSSLFGNFLGLYSRTGVRTRSLYCRRTCYGSFRGPDWMRFDGVVYAWVFHNLFGRCFQLDSLRLHTDNV